MLAQAAPEENPVFFAIFERFKLQKIHSSSGVFYLF